MVRLLGLLLSIAGFGAFICCIILLIKQIQVKAWVWAALNVLTLGVVGIIWGWINLSKHNLRPIMFTWAALFVLQISLLSYLILTGRLNVVTGQPQ